MTYLRDLAHSIKAALNAAVTTFAHEMSLARINREVVRRVRRARRT